MKMNEEKKKHVPYSIEVKITDLKGRTVWKWRRSHGNLLFGLEKTNEYAQTLLGIDKEKIRAKPDNYIEKTEKTEISKKRRINPLIKAAFGSAKPVEPIFGVKRGGERK